MQKCFENNKTEKLSKQRGKSTFCSICEVLKVSCTFCFFYDLNLEYEGLINKINKLHMHTSFMHHPSSGVRLPDVVAHSGETANDRFSLVKKNILHDILKYNQYMAAQKSLKLKESRRR